MRKLALTLMLLCLHGMARGQTGDNKCLYWFDANQSSLQQGIFSGQQWQQAIDVSGLSDALHTVYLMVVDDKGRHSQPVTRTFMKVNYNTGIEGYYWFDKNTVNIKKSPIVNGTFDVDASQLSDGFHTFYYQVTNRDGSVSQPVSHMFLKIAQTENVDYMTCVCSIDGEMYKEQRVSSSGGIIDWEFDVSKLSFGVHRIQVQAVTPSGAATQPKEAFFVRTNTSDELNQMHCVYSVDGKLSGTEAGLIGNGAYHFDIDMSQLTDGIHRLSYQLTDGKEMSTALQTHFFIKNPVGGNGITQYEYWINDLAEEPHQTVLSQPVDPYHLAALLPIESQPLRSSKFHFELKDSEPYIYAKNSLHVRFYDKSQRFTDTTEEYIDYAVAQAVTDVDELISGVRETIEKPAENTIKWYKLEAERGDSLRFHLDRAATVQLFAPSNKEVYNVSGSESVKWGGLHAAETGTFYLALHDVTATQGSTLSLDYEHIDKYAILRQDVSVVGNGGYSTITFEGNGFSDLYQVLFVNSKRDTIQHSVIGHESNSWTSISFDFNDKEIGLYDAIFKFSEGELRIPNCIKIENARSVNLQLDINSSNNIFLINTKATYDLQICNSGNMTAYRIPLFVQLTTKTENGISAIYIDGLDLPSVYDLIIANDTLSDNEKLELRQISDQLNDKHYFSSWCDVDEQGDSCVNYLAVFYLTIPPNQTKSLKISPVGNEEIAAYFKLNQDWKVSIEVEDNVGTSRKLAANRVLGLECYKEEITCVKNIVTTIIKFAYRGKIDCGLSIFDASVSFSTDGLNASTAFSILDILSSCGLGLRFKDLKAVLDFGLLYPIKKTETIISCVKWMTKKQNDNCGDPIGPILKYPVNSLDPNEIYGHEAKSGSKAIMDGLTDVSYIIQFENDTTFATAAAHDIWVRDTLDVNQFDLSTYKPTRVKIGSKELDLDGSPNFIATLGMQPEINAVAQIEGTFDEKTGIICWHLSSLDPMTVEPTNDVMQGILPVNYNGQGIGEVSYDIKLKDGLAHGTEVNNRASIVFDTNEPIMTPTWTNVIDRIAPESHIADVQMATDTTATVHIEATDELSGPWRYDVYVQYGSGAWFLEAENVPIDKTANVKVYEGINHGFYVVVTDSAGNVEQKEAAREYTFEVFAPQVDTNTKLQLAQGWNWVSHNQQEALSAETLKPKAQRIMSQTDELYKDSRFGWTGTLDELLPTQMYKVQMAEADEVQLSGRLFNAAFRAVSLYAGWNWIGYPVAQTMTPAEALQKMEAEEDNAIIGRDGLATYSDGEWTGTLTEMVPGQGYMYRSASDKALFLNATAQASSRKVNGQWSTVNGQWSMDNGQRTMVNGQYPDDWTVDRQRYPNVMGMVAELWQDGKPVEDSGEWLLGAFSGGECRGLAEAVGNHLMMNVYGRGGEKIEFFVMHRESGEILPVSESEEFRADLLGTVRQPYRLNMGVLTGIRDATRLNNNGQIINNNWYDLQGRRISVSSASSENSVLPKGVYIVTDGQKKETQKVVRK